MPRALPARRAPRHHLLLHRVPPPRPDRSGARPVRCSDLIVAIVAVALLGGLALAAAASLMGRALAP